MTTRRPADIYVSWANNVNSTCKTVAGDLHYPVIVSQSKEARVAFSLSPPNTAFPITMLLKSPFVDPQCKAAMCIPRFFGDQDKGGHRHEEREREC